MYKPWIVSIAIDSRSQWIGSAGKSGRRERDWAGGFKKVGKKEQLHRGKHPHRISIFAWHTSNCGA